MMKEDFNLGEVITAMATPFDKNFNIDFKKVELLSQHLENNSSDGILVAGTSGESPTLTHDEEFDLLKCVKSSIRKNTKVIMGAGSNCTKTAIESSQKAQSLGADAILSVVPYYNKPSQDGIYSHFSQIAKNIDIPIILYNIPGRTGINMSVDTVSKLAYDFKNIKALKQSFPDMDLISELKLKTPDDFIIYSGDDSLTLPMLSLGAYGVISVASHIVGNQIKTMISNFKSGNFKQSLDSHLHLYPLMKNLFIAPNPVPVKQALSFMNIIDNYTRLPLTPLQDSQKDQLFSVLKSFI